ncbi:MAG: hypothetical protein P8J79_05130 [Halioglobus sp.]|nr:hypothetical protein [Halioglobus sp.]
MDLILIVLGIVGSCAIVAAAYVVSATSRNDVSHDNKRNAPSNEPALRLVPRSGKDRREGRPVTFPLSANGILVANDRRTQTDRRAAA